jgi:hypothetical protein
MPRASCVHAALALVLSAALFAAGCHTTSAATAPLPVGEQARIEGAVLRVDTAPWAYDGNAVVTVATNAHGEVAVQLPARWNLCQAPAPADLNSLKPGERVQAIGTVTAAGELVVCERASHRLQRLD